MRSVIITQPNHIEVRDIPRPTPGRFDALVKIEACGFCGSTDRHLIAGTQPFHASDAYPAVLGHESIGVVTKIGNNVTKFKVGQRVTRPYAIFPGEFRDGLHSAWGGFSEYGLVRDGPARVAAGHPQDANDFTLLRQNVVPDGIDPVDAALAISLAEVASWVDQLGSLEGRCVVILGTGFAGCAACKFVRLAGARKVIAVGRNQKKLEHAQQCGAHQTVCSKDSKDLPAAVRDATGGEGADVVAEMSGINEVFQLGLRSVRMGGVLAIYGAPEGYCYDLALLNAPPDLTVRLILPKDYLAYDRVCQMFREDTLDPTDHCTHVWEGLDQIHETLRVQNERKALKSIIRIE